MSAFTWQDGPRTVEYGEGVAGRAAQLLREHGFAGHQLVTTERADPGLAADPLLVPHGQVPEVAAGLLGRVISARLVAWGGGRVIDVAKALASATGGTVGAVPTTLSGAEMSTGHRKVPGYEHLPNARPVLVLADPALMTSLPEERLRSSTMNALAHAMEAPLTSRANPMATMAAHRAARELSGGERALGSLLAGYAIDSAGFCLHHVVCQSAVRVLGTPHAETNASVLPHSARFLAGRAPAAMAAFEAELAQPFATLAGPPAVAVGAGALPAVADAALARPELAATPGGAPSRAELLALLEAALAAPR